MDFRTWRTRVANGWLAQLFGADAALLLPPDAGKVNSERAWLAAPVPPTLAQQPPLIGELLAGNGTNIDCLLLECAYMRGSTIYASEVLLDEAESYWISDAAPQSGGRVRQVPPGVAFLLGSLQGAILRGMRHVRHLGVGGGINEFCVSRFLMNVTERWTNIDASFKFRGRLVSLRIREASGRSEIMLYLPCEQGRSRPGSTASGQVDLQTRLEAPDHSANHHRVLGAECRSNV